MLTAFLSSCSLHLWQMYVIFLVFHLAFSLWSRTQHPAHRIKIKAPVCYYNNNKYSGGSHSFCCMVFIALGWGSFTMSFWNTVVHLNYFIFRFFLYFRNPQLTFCFTGVLLLVMPDRASTIVGVVVLASHNWTIRLLISYCFLVYFSSISFLQERAIYIMVSLWNWFQALLLFVTI